MKVMTAGKRYALTAYSGIGAASSQPSPGPFFFLGRIHTRNIWCPVSNETNQIALGEFTPIHSQTSHVMTFRSRVTMMMILQGGFL
jgi:hypothetical protein